MNKRWETCYGLLCGLCSIYGEDPDKVMTKEKYGRFDTSYTGNKPGLQDALLMLEEESLNLCQKCGKKTLQFWHMKGWHQHYCLLHYIQYVIKRFFKRLWYKLGN